MIKEITIREGSTDYIDFQLFSGENPPSLQGNQDIDLILQDVNGDITRFSVGDGKLFITDLTLAKLQLRPSLTDFYHSKSPYKGYFWVYYSPTKRGAFPEKGTITINVSAGLIFPGETYLAIGAKFGA